MSDNDCIVPNIQNNPNQNMDIDMVINHGPDNIKHYSIITHEPIGCTSLVHGKDLTTYPPREITARFVEKPNINNFMEKEGRVFHILRSVSHPNMPRILGCLRATDGKERAYVVFPGYHGDLYNFMKRLDRILDESVAQSFFSQLVDAVEYCHAHYIILRDIKLGKIMFANPQQTQLVIADLINATVIDPRVHRVNDQIGSPAYVAPEILTHGSYDPYMTDIWSLGVILYVLVTNRFPFRDIQPTELFKKITSEPIDIPATVPEGARELLLQMLNRNPANRPTIQQIKQHPWVAHGATLSALEYSTSFPPAPQPSNDAVAAEILVAIANSRR